MSTLLTAAEREPLILDYEKGPALLRAAWESVPEEARQWRPGPGKWSAHEVVVHCADSETYAATRIRLLVGETAPTIIGYDQEAWAKIFDYHSQSTEQALRTVAAVRAGALPILRSLKETDWAKEGRHTESGPYNACDWLKSYGNHLTNHAKQIERNLAAYKDAKGKK